MWAVDDSGRRQGDADLDRLGRRRRKVDRLLRGWESPVLSQGPSFRTPPLSEEASGRLREMLRDLV